MFILGTVYSSASYIIYKIAMSETSNVRVIRTFIENESRSKDVHALDTQAFPGTVSTCNVSGVVTQTISLVDLLKAYNLESSFEAREQLATEAGVTDYRGLAAQNEKISDYLVERMSKSCAHSG